jgi:hypothetical protein
MMRITGQANSPPASAEPLSAVKMVPLAFRNVALSSWECLQSGQTHDLTIGNLMARHAREHPAMLVLMGGNPTPPAAAVTAWLRNRSVCGEDDG